MAGCRRGGGGMPGWLVVGGWGGNLWEMKNLLAFFWNIQYNEIMCGELMLC